MQKGRTIAGVVVLAGVATAGACDRPAPTEQATARTIAPSADLRPSEGTATWYGAPVAVGQGVARTFIRVADGRPVEVGVILRATALQGLPQPTATQQEFPYLLPLPRQMSITPYKVVELDWNPNGHPPVGVYTVPHFDFHFYTVGLDDINSISPANPNFFAQAASFPSAAYVPTNYVPLVPPGVPPGAVAVPHMGLHWFNVTSPEFNGSPFTSTFIYGSWNGRFIFDEPMVTLAYLLSHPNATFPVSTAQQYQPAGFYPSAYSVRYKAGDDLYIVSLSGFAWRGGTSPASD